MMDSLTIYKGLDDRPLTLFIYRKYLSFIHSIEEVELLVGRRDNAEGGGLERVGKLVKQTLQKLYA